MIRLSYPKLNPVRSLSSGIGFAAFLTALFWWGNALGYVFEILPELNIEQSFTDNLELSEKDRLSAYILVLSPGLKTDLRSFYSRISMHFNPEYSIYEGFSEKNTLRFNHGLTGGVDFSRRTKIEFSNRFQRTEEPDIQKDSPDIDVALREGREVYTTNRTELTFTHAFPKDNAFICRYIQQIQDNEDPDKEDKASYNPVASLMLWVVPQKTAVEASVSYTRGEFSGLSPRLDGWQGNILLVHRFSRRIDATAGYGYTDMRFADDAENYVIHQVSAGGSFQMDRHTRFFVNAGYFMERTKENTADSDESGLIFEAAISRDYSMGNFKIEGSTGYDQSYFEEETLGLETYYQIRGSLKHSLSRRLKANLSGSYRNDQYKDTKPERTDEILKAEMGIDFQMKRWLKWYLGYKYYAVDSNLDENDVEENSVSLSLTLVPSNPFRLAP